MTHSAIWGQLVKWQWKTNKNSEQFKRFLRPMLGNTASLVHLLSTVCEISLRKPKVFVPQILQHYLTKEGCTGKLLYCLMQIKEPCIRKFVGLTCSKVLVILQTELKGFLFLSIFLIWLCDAISEKVTFVHLAKTKALWKIWTVWSLKTGISSCPCQISCL